MQKFVAFLQNERGATAVEYGLMAALIAVGCIAAFTAFGNDLRNLFGTSEGGVGNKLTEAQGKLG
jgi:pilus assembly protein Flp/PilA